MDSNTLNMILTAQRNEITEHHVYSNIARRIKDKKNRKIIERIAADEKKHHDFWEKLSKREVKPNRFMIFIYTVVSRILGLSFGLRLMERGEELAQEAYENLAKRYSKAKDIMLEENKHEKELLGMLQEEKIEYASSIVLGLNDALVELTGALAGFTFALQDGKLIGIIGLITGLAASMSMAASGYLASKEEGEAKRNPIKSALYTGVAYIATVLLLVLPFFLIENVFLALGITLAIALVIILAYTFYVTTAKGLKFWRRFLEMAVISLTVAAISFVIGFVIKRVFGIDA